MAIAVETSLVGTVTMVVVYDLLLVLVFSENSDFVVMTMISQIYGGTR